MDPWEGKYGWDDRGHIVPGELGGSRESYNIFSQNKIINQKDYNYFGQAVDDKLSSNSPTSCPILPLTLNYTVTLNHLPNTQKTKLERLFPLRPTSITVSAKFSDNTGIMFTFPNRISSVSMGYNIKYFRGMIK